jgi:hypothetical protein
MLIVKTISGRGLKLDMTWFCTDRTVLRRNRLFSIHKQTPVGELIPGLKRVPFPTKHIDLRQDMAVILKSFDKGTAYEVKRAEKEGVICAVLNDIPLFVIFFNDFAHAKKIRTITEREMIAYGNNVVVTGCTHGNDYMAMHSYIVDKQLKKARLQYSASSYLGHESKEKRAVIGRANRYLHYKDMEYFKGQGFEIYDLGGYASGTKNKELIGVNSFKDSFGGSLVKNEYDFYPVWLYWLTRLKLLFR